MSIERRHKVDRSSLTYLIEAAKVDFAMELTACLQKLSMSQQRLAETLDVKSPYLTRVLRGDENLTMATMVKFADALGKRLNLHLSDRDSHVRWHEVVRHMEAKEQLSSKAWKSFGAAGAAGLMQRVENIEAANDYEAESIAA